MSWAGIEDEETSSVRPAEPMERTETKEDDENALPGLVETPYLFVLFDCAQPSRKPERHRLEDLDIVLLGRGLRPMASRRVAGGRTFLEIQVPDAWMSAQHARLVRGEESWLFEDLSSKNGSMINGERRQRSILQDGDLLEMGHTFFTFRLLKGEQADVNDPPPSPELATIIPDLQRQFLRIGRAAQTGLSIVLTGETGTGKEMLARTIHRLSQRPGNFMAVNCGALASTVLEAELFGVKKGAYTGADRDRDGIIRSAHGGTLFLDEIGELPLASQSAFLRVLQEREVVPVGGTHPVAVDFRLITATNRDLYALVTQQGFRADLLARISGFGMRIPSLRERREDLALLVPRLIARHAASHAQTPTVTPRAMRALFTYAWPMNIRELEKCLEAATALTDKPAIDLDDLPPGLQSRPPPPVSSDGLPLGPLAKLSPRDQRRREEIIGLLRVHGGNVSRVARTMGKGRNQIVRWMQRYDLDPQIFRDL